ncbi:MAG: hypothetical protein ACC608_09475 [Anaerofustis sp.]
MTNNEGNILEFANGAILERVSLEMGNILKNIMDPNTPATKKRSLKIQIDFSPKKDRNNISVSVSAKSVLCSTDEIQLSMFAGKTENGLQAVELTAEIPGQMTVLGEEQYQRKVMKIVGGKN